MKAVYSFAAVVILAALAYVGGSAGALRPLFGIWLPYAAILTFLAGVSYRVIRWSGSPVPFRIPTSCGQQKSLGWIKSGWLENPHTTLGVVARMALEILLFRSLFRNNKVEMRDGPRVVFVESKFLWLGALAFHWASLLYCCGICGSSWSRCPRWWRPWATWTLSSRLRRRYFT